MNLTLIANTLESGQTAHFSVVVFNDSNTLSGDFYNYTGNVLRNSFTFPVIPAPIVHYVKINLHNTQPVPITSAYQQMIVVNSLNYSSYENENLSNIEFFSSNGTVINSWMENGSAVSNRSTYWLKIPVGIPAEGYYSVFMGFAPMNTNLLNNYSDGEAPQLSITGHTYSSKAILYTSNSSSSTLSFNDPKGVLVSSNGNTLFVSEHETSVLDAINTNGTGSNEYYLADQFDGLDHPQGIAFSPNGNTIYVANYRGPSISVVNLSTGTITNTLIGSYGCGEGFEQIAVSPNGNTLYIANNECNTLVVVNTSTGVALNTVGFSESTYGVAVSPNGNTVYVSSTGGSTIYEINTSSLTTVSSFGGFDYIQGIALSPNGNTLYVTNYYNGTVSLVNLSTETRIGTIKGFSYPASVAINPSGSRLYVTNGNRTISAVNMITGNIIATIGGGATASTPNTISPLYICAGALNSHASDSIGTSYTQDTGSSYTAVGHQSNNGCNNYGQAGIPDNVVSSALSIFGPASYTFSGTSNNIKSTYTSLQFSVMTANAFVAIAVACGYSACDDSPQAQAAGSTGSVTVPSGCSLQTSSDYDGYENSSIYACNSLLPGNYSVQATNDGNNGGSWISEGAYVFNNVTATPVNFGAYDDISNVMAPGLLYEVYYNSTQSCDSGGYQEELYSANIVNGVLINGCEKFLSSTEPFATNRTGNTQNVDGNDEPFTVLNLQEGYSEGAAYPNPPVPPEDSSTSWLIKTIGWADFSAQKVEFFGATDDGMTLGYSSNSISDSSGADWLSECPTCVGVNNPNNLFNSWVPQGFTIHSGTASHPGAYRIEDDYYEDGGGAYTALWSNVSVEYYHATPPPNGVMPEVNFSSTNTTTYQIAFNAGRTGVFFYNASITDLGSGRQFNSTNTQLTVISNPSVSISLLSSSSINAYQQSNGVFNVTGGVPPYGYQCLVKQPGSDIFGQDSSCSLEVAGNPTNPVITKQISTGINSNPYGMAFSKDGNYLFTADSGTSSVSVVNLSTGTQTRRISIPGSCPNDVAVTNNNEYIYVTDGCSDNVTVINESSYAVVNTISIVQCDNTYGPNIAMSPTEPIAYVTDDCSQDAPSNVFVINTTTQSVTGTVQIPDYYADPTGVVFSNNGSTAYVSAYQNAEYYIINVSTGTVTGSVAGVSGSEYADITPNGMQVWFGYPHELAILNTTNDVITNYIELPGQPTGVAFNPSGTLAYVAEENCPGIVSVVNVSTDDVINNITTSSGCMANWDVLFSPSNNDFYVAQGYAGNVTVFSTNSSPSIRLNQTPSVLKQIPTGSYTNPYFIASNKNATLLYVSGSDSNNVTVISALSGAPVKSIYIPNSCAADLAATPDGKYLYVSDPCTQNITVINTATYTIAKNITIPALCYTNFGPEIAVSPTEPIAYVTDDCDTSAPGNVFIINTTTQSVTGLIRVPDSNADLAAVAFSKNGSTAYAYGSYTNKIYVINVSTSNVIDSVYTGYYYGIYSALSPDGTQLWFDDLYDGGITVLNTTTLQTYQIASSFYPGGIAFSPNGELAYAASAEYGSENYTYIINVSTGQVVGAVSTSNSSGNDNFDLVSSPLNGYLYVVQSDSADGNVTELSPAELGDYQAEISVTDSLGGASYSNPADFAVGPEVVNSSQQSSTMIQGQSDELHATVLGGDLPYTEAYLFESNTSYGPFAILPSCSVSGDSVSCSFSSNSSTSVGQHYLTIAVGDSSDTLYAFSPEFVVNVTSSSITTTIPTPHYGSGGLPPQTTVQTTAITTVQATTVPPVSSIPPVSVSVSPTQNQTVQLCPNGTSQGYTVNYASIGSTFYVTSNVSGCFSIAAINITKTQTSTPPPPNSTAVLLVNLTSTANTTINATVSYPCNIPSSSVAPYMLRNGSWVPITPFTSDAAACSLSFTIPNDPVIGLFQTSSTTVPSSVYTTVVQTSSPQSPTPYLILLVVIIVVLALAWFLISRGKKGHHRSAASK